MIRKTIEKFKNQDLTPGNQGIYLILRVEGGILSLMRIISQTILILILSASFLDAKQGYVTLKNGHKLPGDIKELPDRTVRVVRNRSAVIFSRHEIESISYDTDMILPKKKKVDPFFHALNTTPVMTYSKKSDEYDTVIEKEARKTKLDSALIKAVIAAESSFDRYGTSHKGAQGLMQLMPSTARSLGVRDAYDPNQNIKGGSTYLRTMLDMFDGDVSLALAAYNAGPEAVKKYGAIPPYRETQNYVRKVVQYYKYYKSEPSFYEYLDEDGCLHLSNYRMNDRYQKIKK